MIKSIGPLIRYWSNIVRYWTDIGPILTGVTPQCWSNIIPYSIPMTPRLRAVSDARKRKIFVGLADHSKLLSGTKPDITSDLSALSFSP